MVLRVGRAFEAVGDVVGLAVAGVGQRHGGRARALAGTAEQQNLPVRSHALVAQGGHEVGMDLHLRIDLPGQEDRLLAELLQVRHTDELPFRHGPHVDQHGFRLRLQDLEGLRRGQVASIGGIAHFQSPSLPA